MFSFLRSLFQRRKTHKWTTDTFPTYGDLEKELIHRKEKTTGIRVESVDKKIGGKFQVTWTTIEEKQ
jgi:IS1 family transposase